jgi:hypothetical protein
MTFRKALLGAVPVVIMGLVPAAADAAVVYCTSYGVPAGCIVRTTPRVVVQTAPVVVVAPTPVVVAPAPVYARPRYYAPRSSVNLGGPVNRVGVR